MEQVPIQEQCNRLEREQHQLERERTYRQRDNVLIKLGKTQSSIGFFYAQKFSEPPESLQNGEPLRFITQK